MVELRAGQKSCPSFAGVVGQTELKRALLAVATNPALSGLLARGEKGTAKSTTVRALADLLPDQRVVADCPYGCPPDDTGRRCSDCRERTDPPVESRPVPVVTLPLGATRERVVGTLSVADALAGDHEFEPGLLARANRGVLYVDEVNLLDDHIVDVLLDAAASGVNRVERDAVSVSHPAAFTLVGTMNPEEGELRPQLRDRFDLQATVTGCADLEDRVAIVEQALGTRGSDGDDAAVRERLTRARTLLSEVDLAEDLLWQVAELCREAGVEGHRADIATARAARTFAALDGRTRVLETDVERAAGLALPHRLRAQPFDDAPEPQEVIDDQFDEEDTTDDGTADGDGDDADADPDGAGGDGDADETRGTDGDGEADPRDGETDPEERGQGDEHGEPGGGDDPEADGRTEPEPAGADDSPEAESGGEGPEPGDDGDDETATPLLPGQARAGVGEAETPELDAPDVSGTADGGDGTRADATASADGTGPRVRTESAGPRADIDAAASVRAAARRGGDLARRDLRRSVQAEQTAALVVFVLDASASMRPAMRTAKGVAMSLLEDAYQGRDEVAVVAFGGDGAEVLLPPTDSVTAAARHLKQLPTADRTPLPAGLRAAADLLDRAEPDAATVVCVTDGRANAGTDPVTATREAARALAAREPRVLVVDADDDRRGVTDLLVEETGGRRLPLDALSADRVVDAGR